MTLRDLIAAWNVRDTRYSRNRYALTAESRQIVKAWRLGEAAKLSDAERLIAERVVNRW